MNKIEQNVWGLERLSKDLGVNVGITDFNKAKEDLIEESYKQGCIENLVNTHSIAMNSLKISNFKYIEDYEVVTRTFNYEGYEFETEDEYKEFIKDEVNEKTENYKIKEIDDTGYYIAWPDGDVYVDGFDTEAEATEELEVLIANDEIDNTYSVQKVIKYGIYDGDQLLEDDFESKEEAEEELGEMKQELIEEYPDFDDLDYEYDEICWNYVYNFGNYSIDEDAARVAGLGILEFNETGDRYLFLTGCGMDMTFQFVHYCAIAYGWIPQDYLDKLGWTKMNVSEKQFEKILSKCGVDIEKLNSYKEKK